MSISNYVASQNTSMYRPDQNSINEQLLKLNEKVDVDEEQLKMIADIANEILTREDPIFNKVNQNYDGEIPFKSIEFKPSSNQTQKEFFIFPKLNKKQEGHNSKHFSICFHFVLKEGKMHISHSGLLEYKSFNTETRSFFENELKILQVAREKNLKYMSRLQASHQYQTQKKSKPKALLFLDYYPENLGDLKDYLDNQKMLLSPQVLQKTCLSLLEALNELNQEEIVHNDLKPENIFFNDETQAVIADFEFSQLINESKPTKGGEPTYRAPERIPFLNESFSPDLASNVWSIGCILHYFTTGYLPHISHLLNEYDEINRRINIVKEKTITIPVLYLQLNDLRKEKVNQENSIRRELSDMNISLTKQKQAQNDRPLSVKEIITLMLDPNYSNRISAKDALDAYLKATSEKNQ